MPLVNNGIPQYRGEIKNENTAYENIWEKKTIGNQSRKMYF